MIDPSALVLLWLVGVVLATSLVGSLVHELGHAVAAAAVGFRVLSIRVVMLEATPVAGRWRVRLLRRWHRLSLVTFDPLCPDGLRGKHLLVTAAGPAAQLLAAGVTFVAAQRWGGLLWVAVLFAGFTILMNLVPLGLRREGFWIDGDWIMAWLLRPQLATQRIALGAVRLAVTAGQRPRDWDERWVLLAAAGPRRAGDRMHVGGLLWAYCWALDRGDVRRAGPLLARACSGRRLVGAADRAGMAAAAAYFVARHRRRLGLARRLLGAAEAVPLRSPATADLELARAAIHLMAGEPEAALAACDRAAAELAAASATQPAGAMAFASDLVGAIRADALAARRTLLR